MRYDRGGVFWFAPLQGGTFERMVPPATRAALPDSVAVLGVDGSVRIRSDGFLYIFRRLGGFWRAVAAICAVVPGPIRDAIYNMIARVRYSVFGRKEDICPVMPAELRKRFLP
jgi:predicted DCC family thiol-disulfide oxidoreductase YuxK